MPAPAESAEPGRAVEPEPALGHTIVGTDGPLVSRLGLGLAALGRPAYINLGHGADLGKDRSTDAMRLRSYQVLDAAVASGILYLDAARSYGEAEQFLASWLASRGGNLDRTGSDSSRAPPRSLLDHLVIGSKWGYTYTAGWQVDARVHEVKDHSRDAFQRQLRATRDLLATRLRLYQIHSVTPDSPVLADRGVLGDLAALRDEGIAVGVTVSGPRQSEVVRRAIEVAADGSPLFSTVQATWNLLESSAGPALAEAHDAGLTVIVKEVLANGRLGPRGDGRGRTAAVLAGVARGEGVGTDAVAIAAALSQPWAGVVLSGAATVEQLASNLRAAAVHLEGDTMDELSSSPEEPTAYWSARSRLPWN